MMSLYMYFAANPVFNGGHVVIANRAQIITRGNFVLPSESGLHQGLCCYTYPFKIQPLAVAIFANRPVEPLDLISGSIAMPFIRCYLMFCVFVWIRL